MRNRCAYETIHLQTMLVYWEEDMEQNTVIKVSPDIGRRFKALCAVRGVTMKEAMETLMLEQIAEHTPPTAFFDPQPGTNTGTEPPPPRGR